MLTVLLPVIRSWTCDAVCEALANSDIPRPSRVVLILDAPGCDEWIVKLARIGFGVNPHKTDNPYPPEGRVERRSRWRAMRKYSQQLVPDGPLLCVEDDVLVCPDFYARLSAIGPHATGVVVGRHGGRTPVIYPLKPRMGSGVQEIWGCGYNCLLTTGEAYRGAVLGDGPEPADVEHTSQIRPLRVDWGCICGHMTESGVLYP